jgi:mono/diheme cytochrome c family protein
MMIAVLLATHGLATPAAAQTFTSDHPGQYTQADIAAGYEVYRTQCAHCHGPFGDLVSGIDLRRRIFKRSSSDEDLTRVITSGVPGTGMPPSRSGRRSSPASSPISARGSIRRRT